MFTRALKLYSVQSWPWIQFSDCLFWLDCLRCIHADDLGNLDDNYDDCLCVDAQYSKSENLQIFSSLGKHANTFNQNVCIAVTGMLSYIWQLNPLAIQVEWRHREC